METRQRTQLTAAAVCSSQVLLPPRRPPTTREIIIIITCNRSIVIGTPGWQIPIQFSTYLNDGMEVSQQPAALATAGNGRAVHYLPGCRAPLLYEATCVRSIRRLRGVFDQKLRRRFISNTYLADRTRSTQIINRKNKETKE